MRIPSAATAPATILSYGLMLWISLVATPAPAPAQSPFAEPPPAPAGTTNAPGAAPRPKVEEISPGVFSFGDIRFSKRQGWIEVPCKVEKHDLPLEYVLVGPGGKKHETLLSTHVDATLFHAVMLLLGVKNSLQGADGFAKPPERLDAKYLATAPRLPGVRVRLEVRWEPADAPGATRTAPIADWLLRTDPEATAAPQVWTYTGSLFIEGVFMARLEQSYVAIITDPSALINNPGDGRDKDRVWRPNPANVPAAGTTVRLHIALDEAAPAVPASQPQPR
ncbi:hypothetical protein DB346_10400 [Verrucomicrobia bacterium LW23]|nr:hypothetical protein DB346_10400 [Verrucomicrobia bacterium LW23]